MTKSKLDDKLEDERSIKFTDYAINKFQITNEEWKKVKSKCIGIKLENSGLKGLKLYQYKKSKRKYFVQNFWFNSKSDYWTVGEFRLDIFGIKDCKTKVVHIMKTHTDDNGLWIKSPKITARNQKARITKAELDDRKMLTVNECIEKLCKADFPKIKKEGTLTGSEARGMALHLIGYNKRTKHLIYNDDEFGNGSVTFKACKKYNTVKPEDWYDLFNKFPSGHGCINKINGKITNGRSIYDHEFGKYLIEELTPGIINTYLDEIPRGWATKRKIINALQILWANSKKYMGPDRPLNPTTREALDTKQFDVSKGKNTNYNGRKYQPETLERMWLSFQKISQMGKHLFQSEALMLMMVSGVRQSECLKIKKNQVFRKGNKDNPLDMDNIILLPAQMTKNRKQRFITITKPVAFILDRLDEIYKQPKFQKYKFINWMFPSSKSTPKSWRGKDGELSKEIMNSRKTRLSDLRECWETMKNDAKVGGVIRMLRKSYASISVKKLGTSAKARKLTGHVKASTLDIHYDVHNQDEIKEYADEVSEVLSFHKK
jgi:integrase